MNKESEVFEKTLGKYRRRKILRYKDYVGIAGYIDKDKRNAIEISICKGWYILETIFHSQNNEISELEMQELVVRTFLQFVQDQ